MKNRIFTWVEGLKRKLRLLSRFSPKFGSFISFFRHYVIGLIDRIDENHLFLYSGSLAFSLFVCIIPLVLILFWILGIFLDSAEVEVQINTFIDTIIPYEAYSQFVKQILFNRISEVIQYRNLAGIIGGLGLLFAASSLFSSIRTILNRIFKDGTEVNYFVGKLRDIGLIFLMMFLFLAATLLLPVLEVLNNISFSAGTIDFIGFEYIPKLYATLFSVSIVFGMFLFLYRVVPATKLRKKAVFVGALTAAIAWEIAKQIFGYYVYNFASYGKIYGAYALIVVIAFWIYYSAYVFLIGAEISKLYSERLPPR